MKSKYILTIIIPVYNVEKYIQKCLDSIYKQGINENLFEVIIINDGTQDKSIDIIHPYINIHKNCSLINQQNQGLSSARNKGIEAAKGDYIWFVDSDDWLADKSLNIVLKYIENKKYNVIASNLIYAFDDSSRNYHERILKNNITINSVKYILFYSLGAVQRFIIKRSFIEKNKLQFYPAIYHEDGEFGLKLIAFAKNVLIIKEFIYMYYQRENGSITSTWTDKNTFDSLIVYKRDMELAKSIKEKKLKNAIYSEALKVLLFAFQNLNSKSSKEIRFAYKQHRKDFITLSLKLLFFRIPIRKKIIPLITLFSPKLTNNLKKYLKSRNDK